MTRWRYAAATDTGLVRETNQDAVFVDDALAIVADGMGGHAAGEVASAMAVEAIYNSFLTRPTIEGLLSGVQDANREVLSDAKVNPERFGMGTTVMVVGLTHDGSGVTTPTMLHVGDSRAYQLRDGALRQLSADHSVAEEWVRMGRLTSEEALTHPRRHQLTRAIGVDDNIEIDVMSLHVQSGDRLLLCSDGLSNELDPAHLAALAGAPGPLDAAVTNLIDAAKVSGGRDNISAVLLEFDEAHEPTRSINTTMSPAPPPVADTVPSRPRKRGPRLTWRVAVGALLLAAVVGAFFFIVHWYAYSTYYLAPAGKYIGVYEGQPNGVMWYKPKLVWKTGDLMSQLEPAAQLAIKATIAEPSITAARNYAYYLRGLYMASRPPTTTTTVPSTTTTTKSAVPTTTVTHATTTVAAKG
ncbi:MAG: serine/threonine-protein phosphatase [Acidobacteria bacterium]|nr:serine/threonine-protein phosphatase [Acidobacteriota bacterium]